MIGKKLTKAPALTEEEAYAELKRTQMPYAG